MVLFAALWFISHRSSDMSIKEADPYPNRRPGSKPVTKPASKSDSDVKTSTATVGEIAKPSSSFGEPKTPVGEAVASVVAASDEIVRAFYNPFSEKWQRIPDGYEAPAAMDLTAWHKKRTDPTEWTRLFAEGKLSEIMPRGGLRVRYRPAWDTHEPILVHDPSTNRTVQVTVDLPKKSVKQHCEVEF